MSTLVFVIETDPAPEQVQYLEDGLYEFNSEATGITDGQGLAIFVKDERGICRKFAFSRVWESVIR